MENLNFDPYAVLGLPKNSNLNQVKVAFMNLSRTTHPDKGGNPELFKIIRGSYDYLVKLHTLSSNQESFYHPLTNNPNQNKLYDVNERANNLANQYEPIPDKVYRNNQHQPQQQYQQQHQQQYPQQPQQPQQYQQQQYQQQHQQQQPEQHQPQPHPHQHQLHQPQPQPQQHQPHQQPQQQPQQHQPHQQPQQHQLQPQIPNRNMNRFTNQPNMNVDRFNKAFTDARVKDSNDHGYGEIMDKGNSSRLDVDVLAKSAGSQFKNQMIVYKNPQDIESSTSNCAQLGQGKINDYSSSINASGIQYSDYRIAMSNAEKPQGNVQKKSLSAIQRERKMAIPEKTQDEINAENEEKRITDLEEMNRQYRQHQMDQQIFRNHQEAQPAFDRMKRN